MVFSLLKVVSKYITTKQNDFTFLLHVIYDNLRRK